MTQIRPRATLRRATGVVAALALGSMGLSTPAFAEIDPADPTQTQPTATVTKTATAEPTETGTSGEASPTEDTAPAEKTNLSEENSAPAPTAQEAPVAAPRAAGDQVTIDLYAISDFHGALDTAPAIDAIIDGARAANPNTSFVSVGDNVGGSAYISSVANDTPTIEILTEMGLEVISMGNHELDKGQADLKDRIIPGFTESEIISANAEGLGLEPYVVKEYDGVTVAFVGTVTDEVPGLVSPAGIEGITFTDPVAKTNEIAAQLKDGDDANGEADVVVALMHADLANLADLSADVDFGFGGHTHNSANLTLTSGGVALQTDDAGVDVAHINLTFDKATGEVVSNTGELIPTEGVTGTEDIQALVAAAQANADELGAGKIASIGGPANRGTNSGEDFGGNRGTESPLGNLIAEGFYAYSQTLGTPADFAIMNPGGLRADLDANDDAVVTLGESFAVQPFGNTFGALELTGEQVRTMLEQQWKPGGDRPILRLGLSENVTYTYDPAADYGSHIGEVYIDGEAVDPAKTYVVASNTFLLAGGDTFDVLAQGKNLTETGIKDNDAFNAWLSAEESRTPDYTQRSFGVTGALTGAVGEEVTLELSSLSMTERGDAFQAKTVEVSLNGIKVATANVDNTITPNLDETGQATVTFTVPQTTFGEGELTITAPLSDDASTVTIPFTVTGGETIEIVNFTDFHGHLENAICLDATITASVADRANAIIVSSGDNIGASPLESSQDKDESTLKFLNALGVEASAVGNHEFDRGYPDLVNIAEGTNGRTQADFSYLAANVAGENNGLSADVVADPGYTIIERGGVTIAFVGTVTTEAPVAVSPSGVEGLTFAEIAQTTNPIADALKDGDVSNGEADFVIALVHDGVSAATALNANVDAVFAGHTHLVNSETVTDAGAPIYQAGQYGENIAYLAINIPVSGEPYFAGEIIPTSAADPCEASPEVTAIVDAANAAAEEVKSVVIGQTSTGLYRGYSQGEEGPVENRGVESSLGNYIGDAFLWKGNQLGLDVDFGMTNSGGVRADIAAGNITLGDVYAVMPFNNIYGTLDITGAQLKQMLEEQWRTDQSVARPLLRLGLSSNVQYTYDETAERGSRILSVTINGEELDPAATYRVASNTFLLEGGDEFLSLQGGTNFFDTGLIDADAFREYIEFDGANNTVDILPPYNQRSIGIELTAIDEATKTATVELWSLSYTAENDKKPATVDIVVDGQVLGTATVDNTLMNVGRDDAGTATAEISFADLPAGTYTLQIVAKDADGNELYTFEQPVTVSGSVVELGDDVNETDHITASDTTDSLAKTGAEVGYLAAGVAILLVLGGTLVAISRREDEVDA